MKLRAADLFCGAGGTSAGAHATGGVDVTFALNHWDRAIQTHSANFPWTKHVNSRLENTSPSETSDINLLFASPECTHHSRARGGKPTSDQQRSGAWHVLPWIEHHRPSWVVIENVVEFREWGPVSAAGVPLTSKRGAMFDAWLTGIRSMGYKIDIQELNAADFGAATSRNRLFVIARKGNRNPVFPEPTHGRHTTGALPGMGLLRWRAAADVIDWSIPCPSIFRRQRPLADKTLLRIEAGLRRFVGPYIFSTLSTGAPRACDQPTPTLTASGGCWLATPFQVQFRNNMDAANIESPVNTITAGGGHHGVATPYIVPNFGEADGQSPRTHSLDAPVPCITSHGAGCLSIPFLADVNHGGNDERTNPVGNPLGTVTAKNGKALVVPFQFQLIGRGAGKSRSVASPVPTIVAARENHGIVFPWISSFYGSETQSVIDAPVPTIVTKDRHSLCVALCQGPQDWPAAESEAMRTLQATMLKLGVCDVGFRMLSNPELAAAQGFDADYIFHGTKAEVTRQVGNSVSPAVAKAMTQAILSV